MRQLDKEFCFWVKWAFSIFPYRVIKIPYALKNFVNIPQKRSAFQDKKQNIWFKLKSMLRLAHILSKNVQIKQIIRETAFSVQNGNLTFFRFQKISITLTIR